MSKYDPSYAYSSDYLPDLPVIDWKSIGAEAPRIIPFDYSGPDAALPKADRVVITWTTAEWSALDHVLVDSRIPRGPYSSTEWRDAWKSYAKGASQYGSDLWGYYLLIGITDKSGKEQRVLLFKSETHLAHPPYGPGLVAMTQHICEDAQPSQLYSIGTAGGASLNEVLGDVDVTNAGHAQMELTENMAYNDKNVKCSFYPPFDLVTDVQKLFIPLNSVIDRDELYYMIYQLHKESEGSHDLWYDDLVNYPLNPDNTGDNKALEMKDKALLTTDYYFISSGDDTDQYSSLEMDDTVIGIAAEQAGVDYTFVRNISDPIIASKAKDGTTIPRQVREDWSSLIYETAGLYTSFNGALTTWALIAGQG